MLGMLLVGADIGVAGNTDTVLTAKTAAAFRKYVAKTETRNAARLKQPEGTLWIEELQADEKQDALKKLRNGEVFLYQVSSKEAGMSREIEGGLIHDWQGAIFIPGANIQRVLSVLQDYNNHSVIYAPQVERSYIETHSGEDYRVYLRFRQKKVVTVVLNTEHQVHYTRD